ncbi:hypothetical protein BLNAU_4361 [Blattamonas nauphoetae]|uniref:Uncharacterized protein n=1 Tax=Blattamonas nauphoetae TaxID=2049346 RepID=A0ABQ9YAD7_9EUKA|nr:hypothetical protein BLNAU_4361 [Blattamonas nauphoetae]
MVIVLTVEFKLQANHLICPQFCLQFNDIDSIVLSGRHYSWRHNGWNTTNQEAEIIIKHFQNTGQKKAQKKAKRGEQVNTDLTVYDWIALSTTRRVISDHIKAISNHLNPHNSHAELKEMTEMTTKPLLDGLDFFTFQRKNIP